MFKLAELFVSVIAETSSLDRALSRTHANLSTANIALGTFAGNVAASFARMAVGAAGGLFEATIGSAAHLGETMNRVKVVLGDSADKVIKDADVIADRYGAVKGEVLGAASSFSLLGREMKLSEAGSADFGIKLTRMATELTSFFDPKGDLPAMMKKLEMGLAGQVRPLRELGIFMTASAVKDEAARMGLKPRADTGQLSEGDKIKARISFIENSKAMQLATGDLERTLSSTANQTRKFWGTLSNLGTSVGQELDPAWNKLLQSFNSGLDEMKGYFEANKSMIRGWGDSVVEGFEIAKVVWRNLPDVLEIALLGADQKMEDARAKIEAWATNIAVSIESVFLKTAQKTGDLIKKTQNLSQGNIIAPTGGFLADAMSGGKSLFEGVSKAFDYAVGKFSAGADVALRPLRDVANATGGGAVGSSGKLMSVEEDFNRMQGALGGIPKVFGKISDYFRTFQDVAQIASTEKPKDFTKSLIDKANKHLADTLAQNTDVSSKGIAAATARITAREARHLDDLANQWIEDTEYDKMFAKKEEWVPATEKFIKDSMDFRKRKEEWGPATEEQLMAEAARNKAKRDAAKDEDEDAAVLGGKTKHHKAIEDSATFVQNLAAQQLGGDVQERQLSELQQIREIDQKNADMMEKMYNRTARAAYA